MTARSIRIISPYDSDLFRQIPNTTTIAGQAHGAAYDLGIGSNFQPRSPTAMTASVRLDTSNALRIAVTWFFTVGSAKLRTRQIALLLFPRRSVCRRVAEPMVHREQESPAEYKCRRRTPIGAR